jgi:hypothetical protein
MKLGFTTAKEAAANKMALAMYEGEPCRICGETIIDATKAVYAGYSLGDKARSAHKVCWGKGIPQAQWAYPQDAS